MIASSATAILSHPARRAITTVFVFALVAPPVGAAIYLAVYAITRRAILGSWNVPTPREFAEYLPDIYLFGTAAALIAGLAVAWRQARGGAMPPAFILVTGLIVGLANAATLMAMAPDFGPPEVPVAVLLACHTVAFMLTTIICWRLGGRLAAAIGVRAS